MSDKINTKPSSDLIREMARTMRAYADRFDSAADELDDLKDFNICGEVANNAISMIGNMRIDLLVVRPVREMEREICRLEKD